jgi:hypothetical protein
LARSRAASPLILSGDPKKNLTEELPPGPFYVSKEVPFS